MAKFIHSHRPCQYDHSPTLKPVIILVAGGLFLFLIVALLLPVYDLVRQSVTQSMGGGT